MEKQTRSVIYEYEDKMIGSMLKSKKNSFSLFLCMILVISFCLPIYTYAEGMPGPPPEESSDESEEVVLVTESTTWNYTESSLVMQDNWKENNYDAVGNDWMSGQGSFGTNEENTLLPETQYYFRTEFTIEEGNISNFQAISGKLVYQDAVSVYINGVLVFEDNKEEEDVSVTSNSNSENTVLQSTASGSAIVGLDTEISTATGSAISTTNINNNFYLNDISMLTEGTNTVAVVLDDKDSEGVYLKFESLSLHTEQIENIKSLSVTIGKNESELYFTWYTWEDMNSELLFANKEDMIGNEFPDSASTYTADSFSSNDTGYYSNQVSVDNLAPGTEYCYQIRNERGSSEIYKISMKDTDGFHFLLAGDPQIGASKNTISDASGWADTMEKALNKFSESSFLLTVGDQVETAASEEQYDAFLEVDELKTIPIATAIGNHDTSSDSYQQHFNLPNESADYGTTNAGGDYWFTYGDVLFMVLNTNNTSVAEHKAFMTKVMTENSEAQWNIVVFHQSLFSVAKHVANMTSLRTELAPVLTDLGIDVVLSGHDHVYTRSYIMNGLEANIQTNEDGSPLSEVSDPEGVLFVTVNSSSGSKFYDITAPAYEYSAFSCQESIANISDVSITDHTFTITTYRTSDMTVVDSFSIKKTDTTTGDEDDGNTSGEDSGNSSDEDDDSYDPDTNNSNSGKSSLVPQMTGSNGVKGWNSILQEINAKVELLKKDMNNTQGSEGQSITVAMNASTVLPKEIINACIGQNIELILDFNNLYRWSINGMDIEAAVIKDIDFAVQMDRNIVPEKAVSALSKAAAGEIKQISLEHNGDFGLKASLNLTLDKKYTGKISNLLYYNEATGNLELQSVGIVKEDGTVEHSISHASNYILYLSDTVLATEGLETLEIMEEAQTLYIDGTTGKTAEISFKLSTAMEEARELGLIDVKTSFLSSNEEVAAVSEKGLVTAKKNGTTKITTIVSIGEYSKEFSTNILVRKAYIRVDRSKTNMTIGEEYTFQVKCYGYSEKDVTFSSDNKQLLSIWRKNGKATAKGNGNAVITVTCKNIIRKVNVTIE